MRRWWALGGLLVVVLTVYSNHFENGFHFDDYHSIVRNPAIRTLNLARFWSDAAAFSTRPETQAYRPLLVTYLALDYRLGGGLRPFWFHLSTFVWYLVLLGLLYLLCDRVFEGARGPALLATALFGLHPASAETVNYIVQRADLYVALGIVAGVTIYARFPGARRWGLHLLPPAAGMLAKPTAAVFAPILLAYVLLFDRRKESAARAALRTLPAFAVCVGGLCFVNAMTPSTFAPVAGGLSRQEYMVTQPYVAVRYFRSFFLPLFLSPDTDLRPCHSVWEPRVLAGFALLILLAGAAVLAGRVTAWRPAAFGLWWFLLGLVPTSVYPLSELENDHRMFLPFIGLSLAVVWTAVLLLRLRTAGPPGRRAAIAASLLVLAACGWGTHRRNEVWRDDESFWRDVVAKSPGNSRGLIDYGFALTGAGKAEAAWPVFQQADRLVPFQGIVQAGFAQAAEALHHGDAEVERHYREAVTLSPADARPMLYYARWLLARGRTPQAMELLAHAAVLDPSDLESRYLLLEIYSGRKDWQRLAQTATEVTDLLPEDPSARRYLALGESRLARAAAAERAAANQPTAENYAALAAVYEDDGQHAAAIHAAERALELRPGYAEAARTLAEAERQVPLR